MDTEAEMKSDKETAPILGVARITLRKWRARGRGPAWVKLEGKVRYKMADLIAFIERNRIDPAEAKPSDPAKPSRIRRSNGTKRK
jgi:hypothetical protein